MSLIVFVSELCKENARRNTLISELERLKNSVEEKQSLNQFDQFPAPYYVKKKLGGRQGRLIAALRTIDEHEVVIFYAIMIRGDREYESKFSKDPVEYGEKNFLNLVSEDEIQSYVKERLEQKPPPAKPRPNDLEFGYLYNAFTHRKGPADEDIVYETGEWKMSIEKTIIANQLNRFTEPCLEALSRDIGFHFIEIPNRTGWGIWVYRTDKRLVLLTPVTEDTKEQGIEVKQKYQDLFKDSDPEEISRFSRRAYPSYMLADEDTWIEIEKEPVANMALSPEESEVLLSARQSEGAFPLFVNGRAGSGKSTILQYLFADLLYYHLTSRASEEDTPPVYLTANGELLVNAQSFIKRVLRSEAIYDHTDLKESLDENPQIIDNAFQEFHPFLLSLVDSQTRLERFKPAMRIDYSKFRGLWNKWFGREPNAIREYGPDISWHVIRTYIKGMQSESTMDSDDYMQLPDSQITVTKETYDLVYERVWEGRYSRIIDEEGYWDDQDLTRYILEHDMSPSIYPAVVCDEAQDFTRVELELLLRLNLFSYRTINPHELTRVPFAFAGDQFQTLNPTGFQWDAIKTSFVEKFIKSLDPGGRSGKADLNYKELKYNYRSTPSIVRFSNGVQALRAALFDLPGLAPQIPWISTQDRLPVLWFNSSDHSFWRKLKDVGNHIIIVPCHEGEEVAYVSNDPILSQVVNIEDGIPQNVVSVTRSKGQEYPEVIVYGFGQNAPKNFVELLSATKDEDELSQNQLLPLQYYINKVYVAVSRAKENLIIVDNEEGFERLWNFARIDDVQKRMLELANRGRSIWFLQEIDSKAPAVEGMILGKVEDIGKESKTSQIENAKIFESEGRSRKDPFLLKQASMAYKNINDFTKAAECKALAHEYEGDFLAAGQIYAQAGYEVPEAVRCFWIAEDNGWMKLIELAKTNASISRETEFRFAQALASGNKQSIEAEIQLLDLLRSRLAEKQFREAAVQQKSWITAVTKIAIDISLDTSSTQVKRVIRLLEEIEELGISMPDEIIGNLYYQGEQYIEALRRWDKAGIVSTELYLKAKAIVEPYPDRITALMKLRDYKEIITLYEANRTIPLPLDVRSQVAESYLQGSFYDEAFALAWEACDYLKMVDICKGLLSQNRHDSACQVYSGYIFALIDQGEWGMILETLSRLGGETSQETKQPNGPITDLICNNDNFLRCCIVKALARSDKFVELPGHSQRAMNDFMRSFLRVKEGHWRETLSVYEAGAALERGGRFTDCIAFYEAILRETNYSSEDYDHAHKRLAVCKQRQIDYERNISAASKKVADLESSQNQLLKKLMLSSVSDLPKYPILDQLTKPLLVLDAEKQEDESPQRNDQGSNTPLTPRINLDSLAESVRPMDKVSIQVGEFKIQYGRSVKRCNIEHEPTMQIAKLDLSNRTVEAECKWQRESDNLWASSDWQMRVLFHETHIEIFLDTAGSMISFFE